LKRFLLLLIAFYATSQFCQKQTDGFACAKVSTLLLENPLSDVFELSHSYRYLGKGGQSYIFVSEDDRYVLKLFRSSRLNTLQLLYKFLPLNSFKAKIAAQENFIRQTLLSYSIAYQHLKEETGLIGVHLDRSSPLSTPLKIIDKLGIAHTLDPNQYPFVIQEKAILVKEKIEQLMHSGDLSSARLALSNLFALIQSRQEKGIEDGDPNLCKNFGFCADRPIQIDGGRFSLIKLPSNSKLGNSKEDLQHWINSRYPELSEDFNRAYEEFLHEAL